MNSKHVHVTIFGRIHTPLSYKLYDNYWRERIDYIQCPYLFLIAGSTEKKENIFVITFEEQQALRVKGEID